MRHPSCGQSGEISW